MKATRKRVPFTPLLLVCVLMLLTSCGSQEAEEENVLIYAALNPVTRELESEIEIFNRTHEDIQIVIHDFSDEGGPQRLLTELVLGKIPDIMEMQRLGHQDFPARADEVIDLVQRRVQLYVNER